MNGRRLGRTDLVVSELGFGGFAVGGHRSANSYGPTDDATSARAIQAALDYGCTFFDTADVYGYGRSEEIVGRAIREAGREVDTVIATKVGGNFESGRTVIDFSRDYLRRAVERSLLRLGRECIDLYQLHNPSVEVIRDGEVFDVLDVLVAEGKVRYYGVSVHTVEEGRACLDVDGVAALQIPYNLFSLLEPETSMLPLFGEAAEKEVALIARQPLAGGFLSGRHARDSSYDPSDIRGQWSQGLRHIYVVLADTLRMYERPGISLAQVALRFVLDEPSVTTTIVGVKTPEQVAENFASLDIPPFDELHARSLASPEREGIGDQMTNGG